VGHEVLHPNERWLPSVVSFKSTVQPINVTVRARVFGDLPCEAVMRGDAENVGYQHLRVARLGPQLESTWMVPLAPTGAGGAAALVGAGFLDELESDLFATRLLGVWGKKMRHSKNTGRNSTLTVVFLVRLGQRFVGARTCRLGAR